MPRRSKKKSIQDRMYLRPGRGWYVDLRDLGRGRTALIDRERGESGACQDEDRAYELAKSALELAGDDPLLRDYLKHHLDRKAQRRRQGTIDRDEISLRNVHTWAVSTLCRDPRLSDISKSFVLRYLAWRETQVADQTLAHELHALSNLMTRAMAEDKALYNPVPAAKQVENFSIERGEPDWLEIGQAAALLRVAGEMDAERQGSRCPYLRPLLAWGLLTGSRPGEILGATVNDVDFKAGIVHIRHNEHRLLKRPWHERELPLWPQLRETLEAYLERWGRTGLLFPSHQTGGMYTNLRDGLREAFKRAKILGKRSRLYITRHTYVSARL